MNKIGLITIHATDNYGAVLQAYATQSVLQRYGDVTIIDYSTPYHSKTLNVVKYGLSFRYFLRTGKDIFRLISRTKVLNKFSNFIECRFNLTERVNSVDDLSRLEDRFDLFFSGSDQIWKPGIVSEELKFEPAYFLDFVKTKRKVSYASSTGGYSFNKKQEEIVINYLQSYSHISVREFDTSKRFSTLLKNNVAHVLDPTLLLTKGEWLDHLKIDDSLDENKYILVYAFKKDALLRSAVKLISKKLNLKIVAIDHDPFLGFNVDTHIKDAGPEDFIKIFHNAHFVVTSSFHGVCFALNFNIPFVAINPVSAGDRLKSLLNAVGLIDRFVQDIKEVDSIDYSRREIFSDANDKLALLKQESIDFIENSILN